jgi:hypothetical protein
MEDALKNTVPTGSGLSAFQLQQPCIFPSLSQSNKAYHQFG